MHLRCMNCIFVIQFCESFIVLLYTIHSKNLNSLYIFCVTKCLIFNLVSIARHIRLCLTWLQNLSIVSTSSRQSKSKTISSIDKSLNWNFLDLWMLFSPIISAHDLKLNKCVTRTIMIKNQEVTCWFWSFSSSPGHDMQITKTVQHQ